MADARRQAAQISLCGVSKIYGDVVGLAPTSLEVAAGEFFSLLGPSGCGKSTLLKLIAGFEAPSSGAVSIGGRDVTGVPPERRRIGFVFQNYALFPMMSVFENVAFGLRARGDSAIDAAVARALDMVELEGLGRRRPHELSGGQQQRVALARAIVVEPDLLLLDEPLAALDKRLRQSMQSKLVELQRALGITTIFVTHDQEEALTMSDRIAVMSAEHHSVEQIGTPREIYRRPNSRMVSSFLGHTNMVEDEVVSAEANGRLRTRRGFCAVADGAAVGDVITFAIRPERIRIRAVLGVDEPSPLSGTIRRAIFLGDGQMYDVALDGGTLLRVRTLDESGEDLAVGTRVELAWAADAFRGLAPQKREDA